MAGGAAGGRVPDGADGQPGPTRLPSHSRPPTACPPAPPQPILPSVTRLWPAPVRRAAAMECGHWRPNAGGGAQPRHEHLAPRRLVCWRGEQARVRARLAGWALHAVACNAGSRHSSARHADSVPSLPCAQVGAHGPVNYTVSISKFACPRNCSSHGCVRRRQGGGGGGGGVRCSGARLESTRLCSAFCLSWAAPALSSTAPPPPLRAQRLRALWQRAPPQRVPLRGGLGRRRLQPGVAGNGVGRAGGAAARCL